MLRWSSLGKTTVAWVGQQCSRWNRHSMWVIVAFLVAHSGWKMDPLALAPHPQFNRPVALLVLVTKDPYMATFLVTSIFCCRPSICYKWMAATEMLPSVTVLVQ
jgi:hypothetical protein